MILRQKIIRELGVKPSIEIDREIVYIVNFIKSYLKRHDFLKSLILGISGGQDSTLTGKLCQTAISELRKENVDNKYQFIAVRMPYGIQIDEKDCRDAVDFINPDNIYHVDIKPSILASEKALNRAGLEINDFIRGNMKARERMKIQYSIAGMTNGIVVGSSHASEIVTGFYTKYGDGGTDINPINYLSKRQVKLALIELGCPNHLYEKIPMANLEDERPFLSDEVALGLTYKDIDDYLENKPIKDFISRKVEDLYLKHQHKRHLPFTKFDFFKQ